ncbi:DMT family transporter [Maribacter sp. 2304DJ31-5]|uniref:DMT family transporter n=1 Tax=Maribacter sp. 2304DJ31-5 TaxID=3386273 RepID=UPI0039BC6595
MKGPDQKWFYLIFLSLIWGSSFILIKKALIGFTPIQLGGLRILLAASFLLLLGFKSLKAIRVMDWKWIVIAGLCSSFFPPFLFALAQTEIDSGVTSIFNSVAPLCTSLVGVLLFGLTVTGKQLLGVVIGFFGTIILLFAGMQFRPDQNYWYAAFIIISALGYAFNINIIKKHLAHLSPLAVTTGSFVVAVVPALAMLMVNGVLIDFWTDVKMRMAIWFLLALAIVGTALANMLFNKLIHISSPVFAASVTYTIPLVAVLWGVWDGEVINIYQILGGCVILIGVWMVNKRRRN